MFSAFELEVEISIFLAMLAMDMKMKFNTLEGFAVQPYSLSKSVAMAQKTRSTLLKWGRGTKKRGSWYQNFDEKGLLIGVKVSALWECVQTAILTVMFPSCPSVLGVWTSLPFLHIEQRTLNYCHYKA